MFDPSKLIFGFNDLALLPKFLNGDRKVIADKEMIKQKNGKSRILIAINTEAQIQQAILNKGNYYIANLEVDKCIKILENSEIENIIPSITIDDLLKNKKRIQEVTSNNKTKTKIIIDLNGDNTKIFDLLSSENQNYINSFDTIIKVAPSSDIINSLCAIMPCSIIVDNPSINYADTPYAYYVHKINSEIECLFGKDEKRSRDLFEKTAKENTPPSVISYYDQNDPFCLKSIALGSQFIIIDLCDFNLINIIESSWLDMLKVINSDRFAMLYNKIDTCFKSI